MRNQNDIANITQLPSQLYTRIPAQNKGFTTKQNTKNYGWESWCGFSSALYSFKKNHTSLAKIIVIKSNMQFNFLFSI